MSRKYANRTFHVAGGVVPLALGSYCEYDNGWVEKAGTCAVCRHADRSTCDWGVVDSGTVVNARPASDGGVNGEEVVEERSRRKWGSAWGPARRRYCKGDPTAAAYAVYAARDKATPGGPTRRVHSCDRAHGLYHASWVTSHIIHTKKSFLGFVRSESWMSQTLFRFLGWIIREGNVDLLTLNS